MTGPYSGESGRTASADAIVNRIDREREDLGVATTGEHNRSLDWNSKDDRQLVRQKFQENGDVDEAILPGFGPEGLAGNARDDCGDSHPFICDSCGHSVEFGRTCGQSVSARCGVVWVRDTAIRKAAKVRRIRKETHYNTPNREHQKEHHAVISAPLSWYYDLARAGYTLDKAQERTRTVVKAILDELRGPGVLIRHSFRGKREDGSIKSEADDRGAWKERLNSDREWYGDVRDQLAWMPHYHSIVIADYLKGGELVERVEEATGWVLHRIADDETGVSLEDDGAMARALTYCLSHADIDVRENSHNRSCVWEVGSFQGDAIKSSSRFSARPGDLEWADNCVRRSAQQTLGVHSGTTECGASIPPVDDPDELARQILEEIFPDEEAKRKRIRTDTVLDQVAAGNITVEVSTTSGGGQVSVRSAFGQSVDGRWSELSPSTWSQPTASFSETDTLRVRGFLQTYDQDYAETGHDCDGNCDTAHDDNHRDNVDASSSSQAGECNGRLIPLGEARQKGLLKDHEWCRQATHIHEAREADLRWPEDLEPWRSTTSDDVGAIGAR